MLCILKYNRQPLWFSMKYYSVHRHKLSCVEVCVNSELLCSGVNIFLSAHSLDTGKYSQDRTWEMDRGHKSTEGEIQMFRVRTPAWDLLLAVMATAWQHMLPISHSNLQWFDWPKIVRGGRYRHTSSIKMLSHILSCLYCSTVYWTWSTAHLLQEQSYLEQPAL